MFGVSKDIWNGYSSKEKLYVACKKLGVLKVAQFVNRKILGNPSAEEKISAEKEAKREQMFHNEFELFLNEIEKMDNTKLFDNILFSGYLSSFRKGGNRFLQRLMDEFPMMKLVAMSQSGKELTIRERKQIKFDTLIVPRVPFEGGYDKNLDINLSEEMLEIINKRCFLQEAIENIKSYHDDMGEGYAEALVYYTYLYTQKYIECLKPACIIVHNKLYSMHDVIVKTCEEKGVKALYFEFGALPGTFALEDKGQMGASHVSTDYDEFRNLPVTQEEIEAAEEVCKYLKESGLNRNQQISKDNSEFWSKMVEGRPIILYAGQNDYDSGICPYTEYSKKFHSPIFKDSDEAAIYLAEIAKKYNWNLIYKPHPLPVKHGRCLGNNIPENVIWVSDININEIIDKSDVVVTILSQVGDVALLREKATVMLGYTQLRGKGCAYEAYVREDIEKVLVDAVEKGYTVEQKKAFIRHVAQVNKYYLYDDLNPRDIRFGRSVVQCAEYVRQQLESNISKDKNVKKAVFYCENIKEIVLATQIKKQVFADGEAILVIDKIQEDKLEKNVLESYFISIKNIESLESLNVDYLFSACVDNITSLYEKLKLENTKLEIYLFDNLEVGMYCLDYKKMKSEVLKNVKAKLTWNKSLEIWQNSNIKYIEMKPGYIKGLEKSIRSKRAEIKEKYIFVESKEFFNKIITNELDILEEISQIVGKDNIIVILFSDESYTRFRMRGYNIGSQNQSEWQDFLISDELDSKVILGLYPNNFISPNICTNDKINCKEIYFYPLLVGNVKYIESNTFARFMNKYKKISGEINKNMYVIEKMEQFEEIINYIGE